MFYSSTDEAERSLHDALAVLSQLVQDTRVVYGAGCAEMAMAEAVDTLARTVGGKKSLAVEAFARALRQIPTIILDNGGWDSAEVVAKLRAAHHSGESHMGIGMLSLVMVVNIQCECSTSKYCD